MVASACYSDAALSVYMKVKALGQRAEGCTAGTRTLARYLGLSKATVERGVAQLRSPAPDGIVELPVNERRSLPGGSGTTARRRLRPMTSEEPFIWLPVAACEDLKPRHLRAYAVLCYAQVRGIPLTEGELAGFLRHHSGPRAGRPLTAQAAGRAIDALDASGWVVVERRSGPQGRHRFIPHDRPPVPGVAGVAGSTTGSVSGATEPRRPGSGQPPQTTSCRAQEVSGSAHSDASLVYEEDQRTERPDDEPPLAFPAGGEAPVGQEPRSSATASPVSALPGPVHHEAPPRIRSREPLTFSARVHEALEPVRWMLPALSLYVQRLVGREVGRQLTEGASVGRVRGRLEQRLARTMTSDIRDSGRWLVGVALPRRGCANPDCESGVLWSTGARCGACREARLDRRAGATAVRSAEPRRDPQERVPLPRPGRAPQQPSAPARLPVGPNSYYLRCRAELRAAR
ncbi:hypothetical protein [Streptomyces sp. NBC_01471]|uniref:hypothetical protein n=1 Tax=Streptomyces sp. NBC_01471 TaxID=2903879 RepID=UPI00352CB9DF